MNTEEAEVIMLATAFNIRTLYRVWCRQLGKVRKANIAGTYMLSNFTSFAGFICVNLLYGSEIRVLAHI